MNVSTLESARETIFALSTAPGRAAVAIFRISGPDALKALECITDRCIKSRETFLSDVKDPENNQVIDSTLILTFLGPKSFTGEDCVEIQCHGSPAIIARLSQILASLDGLRPAQPGEFTRRAYDNGKMDLIEVEGLGDLIHAETEAQRRQAMGLASGDLSQKYLGWRDELIALLAYQEALIDFSEEDLPDDVEAQRKARNQDLLDRIQAEVDASTLKQAIRDGIRVVIIGAPNAGKSSLLNALVKRDAAIVTDIAGTTRDLIEVDLDLGGFPIILTDTAGLRKTEDAVEAIGVDRAKFAAENAEIVIELSDLSKIVSRETISSLSPDLRVGTKLDLANEDQDLDLCISVTKNIGIEDLKQKLSSLVEDRFGTLLEAPSHTRARHADELARVASGLQSSNEEDLPELAAESIRSAISALDRLVGKSDVEDVLDVIFSDFCIGK